MLLIPIGTEAGELNRMPYVTFTVIGLCVAVYLLDFLPGEKLDDVWLEIHRYYYSHDYLDIPDALGEHPRGQFFYQELVDLSEQKESVRDGYSEFVEENQDNAELLEMVENILGGSRDNLSESEQESEQEFFDGLVARFIKFIDKDKTYQWGFIPAQPTALTSITYLFLHGGFWHLIGNMLFFYCTAPFIEDRWGRSFFLAFFLLSGIVAALMFMVHYPGLNGPLIGASGAISAVMGAFLILFYRARLRFLFSFFFFFIRFFYARVWVVVPIFFFLDLLSANLGDMVNPEGGTGVAYWAHVWGFIFGVVVACGLKLTKVDKKLNPMGIDLNDPEHNPIAAADQLISQGKAREALLLMGRELDANNAFADLAFAYWERALEYGDQKQLTTAGLKLLRFSIGSDDTDQSCYFWTQLQNKLPEFTLPPSLAIKFVSQLAKDPDADEIAFRVLKATFKRSPRIPAPHLAAMAQAASRFDAVLTREIMDKALSMDSLSERDRKKLRGLAEILDQRPKTKITPAAQVVPWKKDRAWSPSDSDSPTIDLAAMDEDPEIETIAPRAETANARASTNTTYADDTHHESKSGIWAQSGAYQVDLAADGDDALPVISDIPKIKAVEVVPEQFSRQGVQMLFPYQKRRKVKFDQFHAVAMGAIKQKGSKPFLIIDLVLDRLDYPREEHRVLRMYSTQFNPMKLFPDAPSASQAFFSFVLGLVKYSRSYTWPSQEAVTGRTPVHYASIDDFETKVYGEAVY